MCEVLAGLALSHREKAGGGMRESTRISMVTEGPGDAPLHIRPDPYKGPSSSHETDFSVDLLGVWGKAVSEIPFSQSQVLSQTDSTLQCRMKRASLAVPYSTHNLTHNKCKTVV